jgi:hypothetical protein
MRIRYSDLISRLEYAVNLKGKNYIYPFKWKNYSGQCKYFVTIEDEVIAACLFGVAFENEMRDALMLSENGRASSILRRADLDFSNQLGAFIDALQLEQDNGSTWGSILARAKDIAASELVQYLVAQEISETGRIPSL